MRFPNLSAAPKRARTLKLTRLSFCVALLLSPALASILLAETDAKRIQALFDRKEYRAAVEALKRAARSEPPAQGLWHAARAGHAENHYLNDPKAAIASFELSLSLGGAEHTWILGELALAHLRNGNPTRAMEYLNTALALSRKRLAKGDAGASAHRDQLVTTLALVAQLRTAQDDFKGALSATEEALGHQPDTKNAQLACERFDAAIWLGHSELAAGRYEQALSYYKLARSALEIEATCQRSRQSLGTEEHVRTAQERLQLGSIQPARTFRACAAYVEHVDFDFLSASGKERVRSKRTITERQVRRAKIGQGVLQRYVETFTGGALTISYQQTALPLTLREMSATHYGSSESRVPVWESAGPQMAAYFFRERKNCDGFFLYWEGTGTASSANGGLIQYPYINYQRYGPLRGMISFPLSWDSPSLTMGMLHEFFHVTEGAYGIAPTHGFLSPEKFPGWGGRSHFDYFRWQLREALPKAHGHSWEAFALQTVYPERTDEAVLASNRAAVSDIAPEHLKRAVSLSREANDLYYNKKDRARADALFKEAHRLNPHQVDTLKYLAGRAVEDRDYRKGAELYGRIVELDPEVWSLAALSGLLIWHLERPAEAVAVIQDALKLAPGNSPPASAILHLGHAYMKMEKYAESLEAFERMTQSPDAGAGKPTMLTQAQFWKGFLLGEKLGRPGEAYSYIRGAVDSGWSDEFTQHYLKKYTPANGVRYRSLGPAPAPPGSPKMEARAPTQDFVRR